MPWSYRRRESQEWGETTIREMYTFLVTVLMGIVKKNTLREYWSTDPMFATLFSEDRFCHVLTIESLFILYVG